MGDAAAREGPEPAPGAASGGARTVPASRGPTPAAPASGTVGVPTAISPPEQTALPKLRTLPLGFSWTPVEGAEAYILEVEEQSGSAWLPSMRKPVRTSAATLEIERVAGTPGALRWRVRAVAGGSEGSPCAWVTLR